MNTIEERKLWGKCLFVFDTSALIDFYSYSDNTIQTVFKGVFTEIEERLWMPNRVKFEFLRLKERKKRLPIEKYNNLISSGQNKDSGYLSKIKKDIVSIEGNLKTFLEVTNKGDKHPYLNSQITSDFKKFFDVFKVEFGKFESRVKSEIEEKIKRIEENGRKDGINKNIQKYFQVGDELLIDEIFQIIKEGEFRYRNEIPPGYKDAIGHNKKTGVDKYGDLIIWEEIIRKAKVIKQPIVFVTNDVKEDWCYRDEKDKNKIEKPRDELIKELHDKTGMAFCMYTSSQFIFKAKELLNIELDEKVLKDVNSIQKIRNRKGRLIRKMNKELAIKGWIYEEYGASNIKIIGKNPSLPSLREFNQKSLDYLVELENEERIGFQVIVDSNEIEPSIILGIELLWSGFINDFYLVLLDQELGTYHEEIKDIFQMYAKNNSTTHPDLITKFGFIEMFD